MRIHKFSHEAGKMQLQGEREDTMMAIASKLTSIGIIAFSFAIGFLSLYYFSDLTKDEKKKHLEELLSQIINFVLLIWLGKIILTYIWFSIGSFVCSRLSEWLESFLLCHCFDRCIASV